MQCSVVLKNVSSIELKLTVQLTLVIRHVDSLKGQAFKSSLFTGGLSNDSAFSWQLCGGPLFKGYSFCWWSKYSQDLTNHYVRRWREDSQPMKSDDNLEHDLRRGDSKAFWRPTLWHLGHVQQLSRGQREAGSWILQMCQSEREHLVFFTKNFPPLHSLPSQYQEELQMASTFSKCGPSAIQIALVLCFSHAYTKNVMECRICLCCK